MPSVTELVNRLRQDVLRDTAVPYLFATHDIIRALSTGYRLFARHTHCLLREFTLTTVAGQSQYTLDPTVCFVRQVTLDGRYLTPYTRRAKPRMYSGRPTAYSTDAAQSRVRLYPVPDGTYSLTFDCAIAPATLTDADTIDLPDEWVACVMDYAAARLLNNNDPDGSQQAAAVLFEKRWRDGLLLAKQRTIVERAGDEPSAMPQYWT